MKTIAPHGLPATQNTWQHPAPDITDDGDEDLALPEGWEFEVVDHHLVAMSAVPFDGDRVVDVRLDLPVIGGTEIEGLLQRVAAAVRQPVTR